MVATKVPQSETLKLRPATGVKAELHVAEVRAAVTGVLPLAAEGAARSVCSWSSFVFAAAWFAAVAAPVVFVTIWPSEVFALSCFADVAAPEGSVDVETLTLM